jgi:hypothetical protein
MNIFKNKVILPGQKPRDKEGLFLSQFYHLWLAFVAIAFVFMRKHIKDMLHFLIFMAICIPMCYIWQLVLTQTPGVFPAWFFWDANIFFNFPILGMTFEDAILFHPFGQMFGYIFLVKFGIFKKQEKVKPVSYALFASLFVVLLIPAIFLDFSSLLSFFMFAALGTVLILFNLKDIDIIQFIKFFIIISFMSVLMDWSCVTLPIWLGYPEAQGWAYRNGEQFSQYLSNKPWSWVFGNEPISILIVYPWSYMLWMTGLFATIKKVLRG